MILPKSINALLSYAQDHVTTWEDEVSSGGGSAFGLDTAKVTALQNALTAADGSVAAAQTARSESKSATITQNSDLTALRDLLSSAITDIKAYAKGSADPNEAYAAMDIPAPDTNPTKHFPVTPANLVVNADAQGNVRLSWDGNGNAKGVQYVIEGSADGTNWSQIYNTGARKASLSGFTPGTTYWFRVAARQNEQTSTPTASVPVWGTGGSSSLTLAA